jgi:sodium-coupled monocarboxylate transporter 8/12
MTHFSWLDYSIFGGYLALSACVGLMAGGKGKSLSDYLLAGRGMNRWVVAMTVLASLFSGISYLAGPAEVYEHGLGFTLVIVSFFIATPFTAIFLLPKYYNSRYFTAYHYFQDRFGLSVRLLASGLFILRVSVWLGAAIFAPALALKSVTGLPLSFTILSTGIVATLYTMKGGMKAVIWTDVMQLAVLFGGQLIIMFVAAGKVDGGFAGAWETAAAGGRLDISFSLDPHVRITLWSAIIGGTFLNLVQMATDQVSVQRYLTAGSLREAQQSLWIKLWIFLPVFMVFYGTGLLLYAFYQQHGDPLAAKLVGRADQILPYFVVTQLPAGLPGLLTAAIFAASMSTISAGVNSLTSATLCDFYQTLGRAAQPSDEVLVRRARHWTLFYGLIVTLFAFVISAFEKNLLESVNTIIGIVGGPMLGLFLLGMFTQRADKRGAICGCVAGLAASLFITLSNAGISFLWYTLSGVLVTMLVGLITSGRSGSSSARHQ